MVMRLMQRLQVRRRNSSRVTISLKCLCEICKLRSHICKHSRTPPVDVLSVPKFNKRLRLRSPAAVEDEEASCFVDSYVSDQGFQSDSVLDSSPLRTPRVRKQEKFRFVASRFLDRCTPYEIKAWLTTTANESMALTGQYSNVLSKPDDMGPSRTRMYVLL